MKIDYSMSVSERIQDFNCLYIEKLKASKIEVIYIDKYTKNRYHYL